MPNQIPLDPTLPAHFFDLRNEDRSKEELDAWWDHPFGQTREDGTIDVEWVKRRAQPSPLLDQPPKLVRLSQRPDRPMTVLKEFESMAAMNAYVEAAGTIEGLIEALAKDAAPASG